MVGNRAGWGSAFLSLPWFRQPHLGSRLQLAVAKQCESPSSLFSRAGSGVPQAADLTPPLGSNEPVQVGAAGNCSWT